MPTNSFSVEDLVRASKAMEQLIAGIGADQWGASTPCPQWSVRDLVGHLVGGDQMFAALLNGDPMPGPGGDPLGDDPVAAYRTSSAALHQVAALPGVQERSCAGPLGDTPTGAELVQLRLADLLVHGWDLGQAIGVSAETPESDDLAERALASMQAYLTAGMRGAPFAEPQPVAETATALERLAAFCGRAVSRNG